VLRQQATCIVLCIVSVILIHCVLSA